MTGSNESWALFENAIKQLTPKTWAQQELIYLRDAYLETERIWAEEVKKISAPRIVLLGEAPLFGKLGNYIYNPETPPSAFLRPSDFAGYSAAGTRANKNELLSLMRQSGMVVIDAFPFALNTSDTLTLNFDSMRRTSKIYQKLLNQVFEAHVLSKISMLNEDLLKLKVLVRYRGMMKPIRPLLEKSGFSEAAGTLKCVGSTNMHIDKAVLADALK